MSEREGAGVQLREQPSLQLVPTCPPNIANLKCGRVAKPALGLKRVSNLVWPHRAPLQS